MKKEMITCEVIQDLLPLYEDGCCSEQSRKIVETHLGQCSDCRDKSRLYRERLPLANYTEKEEEAADQKGIRQGIRLITRWRRIGILSLCLVLLLVFVGFPAWNYIRCEGLTYANLKATYTAYTFKNALLSGNYEKAYGLLDIQDHYTELLATDPEVYEHDPQDGIAVMEGVTEIEERGFDWYEETCREKFFQNMASLEELNETLSSCSNFRIERQPRTEKQSERWFVYFDARTKSGKSFNMRLDIYKKGIYEIYASTDYLTYDIVSREETVDEELAQQELMLSRFYRSPSVNETVMEILYDKTDYDWRLLFQY